MQIPGHLGTMTVHDDVIAALAGLAALETYGIVGMAAQGSGIAELWHRESFQRAVKIQEEAGGLRIDAYVVAAYGTRLPEVARQAADAITHAIEGGLGVKPARVTVHIAGIKAPDRRQ
jgi:uncharacterized alkaline shock family protein YloU